MNATATRLAISLAFFLACMPLAGCERSAPPTCTGASCSCASGATCDIRQSDCGAGECDLSCDADAVCRGSCGASCDLACASTATCEMTVGEGGSVSCSSGADCHIRCTGSCSVSCGSGSNCTIRCASDGAARAFDGSATCG